MCRVFLNVLDNALKYSFKGTRVYITLEEMNGKRSHIDGDLFKVTVSFPVSEQSKSTLS